uniref:Uncharacterized protein n=1 Tax=Plectus sambesii TaxID=2011161 RepID=A0A914UNG4_9BILA
MGQVGVVFLWLILLLFVFESPSCAQDTDNDYEAEVSEEPEAAVESQPIGTLKINASYQAWDIGLNLTDLEACQKWSAFWEASAGGNSNKNVTAEDSSSKDAEDESESSTEQEPLNVEQETVTSVERMEEIGLDPELLKKYLNVVILYKEICHDYPRVVWFNTTAQAREIGLNATSPICAPFKEALNPDADKLVDLASILFNLAFESTNSTSAIEAERQMEEDNSEEVVIEAKSADSEKLVTVSNETSKVAVQIDSKDGASPTLMLGTLDAVAALGLKIDPSLFTRHEKVGLYLPGVCGDVVPTAVNSFNASDFDGVDIEGNIGINVTALEASGVNLTELAEILRNDSQLDLILSRTADVNATRTLGGSFILPVLNKNKYDPFSPPIVFEGSAVGVRFGIYIESMSNFEASTMDYDMDIYLLMAWRDPRLVNPFDKPILIKEEEILEKIWRPDPFFANAKEAEFHEVTFLNFLMRIFPDGQVLYETRIKLKPACNLVLCKYPHDKQTCELLIKSFAYPIDTVRFEWFSDNKDAIDKNPDVKLPELYIDKYEPTVCNGTRKSGNFACLRAVFNLKRDIGFHVAQTYIPTSLALMFSWVGVWLPEEFMEGRIGVAITVLLTLSTESAGAREHLPSVSYLKAIDLWFGFITGFVFFTLLQTLFVIGFDKRASQLRKWATKKKTNVTQEARDAMIHKAERYHKVGRYLDNFCRVFFPLSFAMFLVMYFFVFTEGAQDDCLSR